MGELASEHIYTDIDGNVVPGNSPAAQFLAVPKGRPVPAELAGKMKTSKPRNKQAKPAANKAQAKAEE